MESLITTPSLEASNGTEVVHGFAQNLSSVSSSILLERTTGEGILLEPQRDSLYIVIPVTIIYVSIFFTGTIGNISTCIVIARNKSMHTATNYYLFSLAISDLLLLVSGLPAEIYLVWCKYPYVFGDAFCVLRGLAAETSTNASVLTITAFTVERYLAICHPFLAQTMSKLSRAVKLILVVWLVALSFAIPQILQFGVVQNERYPEMVMCTVKTVLVEHSFELSTFLFFVVPMILITVLYVLIGLKLRKSSRMKKNPGRNHMSRNNRHPGRSSQRVLKMLVAVVIAFFVCWVPFHVQRLIAIYGSEKQNHLMAKNKWMAFINMLMTYISGVFYYVSTTINPILYNIMSNKFRVAFKETLSRSCLVPGLKIRQGQRFYSSLSRSQQRTTAYGSKMVSGPGTGAGSNESNSRSFSRDSSSKSQSRNASCKTETKGKPGTEEAEAWLAEEGHVEEKGRPIWQAKYTAVRVSGLNEPGKKCWRFLKWLPGLKSLKLAGRSGCSATERRTVQNPQQQCEEFSMTVRNGGAEPRPV